jgi:hypothetical protein
MRQNMQTKRALGAEERGSRAGLPPSVVSFVGSHQLLDWRAKLASVPTERPATTAHAAATHA